MYFCYFIILLLFLSGSSSAAIIPLNQNEDDVFRQFGHLYLNESLSDVVFYVGNLQLPAHQHVLEQRSPALNEKILNADDTSAKKIITLAKTELNVFMPFLKYIYTGAVDFKTLNIDVIFGVNQLAIKYKMPLLEELIVNYIKTLNNIDSVIEALNAAVRVDHKNLTSHCLKYLNANSEKVVDSESFNMLSANALTDVLKENTLSVPKRDIFRAFVSWMKVNDAESQHFPSILKHIDLRTMAIDDIVAAIRPLKLISADDLVNIVWDQSKRVEYLIDNVLGSNSDAKVLRGGHPTFFTVPMKENSLKHNVTNDTDDIVVDLRRLYKLNHLVMELADGDKSYVIDVSEDNVIWTRIINYSNYTCRSVQKLYFNMCVARFIRICGTSPADGTFEITHLEAHYRNQPLAFDPETNIVIPKHNVALISEHAVVIEGHNEGGSHAMLNGDTKNDDSYTWNYGGAGPIIVQLPQPYLLESMNLLIRDNRFYDYGMEVSTDKINWTEVITERNVNLWRPIKFTKRPVVFIKLCDKWKGTWLMVRHLECPAITTA